MGVAIAGGVIPQGSDLQPSGRGRPRTRLADQRRLLDDLPPPAARPAGRRRARHRAPRGSHEAADGRAAVGCRLHGVRVSRPDPALPARVRPPGPPGVHAEVAGGEVADRRAQRVPAARPRAGRSARAHRAGRPGDADVRPRPPAVHAGAEHEPRARAPRPAEDWAADRRLVSLLAWGRLRSIARRVYDRLGLHGKVAVPTPPIDWSKTRAYTSVTSTGEGVSIALAAASPRARGPGGRRARARRGRQPRCSSSPTRTPGSGRSARCGARRRCCPAPTSTARPTCCWRRRRSTA